VKLRMALSIAALLFAAGMNPARAQAPLEPAQMSPRTLFYVIWRGCREQRRGRLFPAWRCGDDAEFCASAVGDGGGDAEFFGGKIDTRETDARTSAGARGTAGKFVYGGVCERAEWGGRLRMRRMRNCPRGTGMFFVYDRRGKELLLAKAVLRLRAAEKEAPVLSQVSIGGVQVLKSEGKSGTSYWAEHGKYAVGAGERAVMEDILGRLDGKVTKAETLAQSAAYQEAQANLGGGLLEFFLRVPDMKELGSDSKTGTFQAGPLLQAARIDAVHSIGGRVIFEWGEDTRAGGGAR